MRKPSITKPRTAVILVMMLGWFLASNHCVLAAITSGQATPWHSHCHGSQAPARSEQMVCCKVLPAMLAESNDAVAENGLGLALQPGLSVLAILPGRSDRTQSTDTRSVPRFSASFAELILQRSILAHAPPSL